MINNNDNNNFSNNLDNTPVNTTNSIRPPTISFTTHNFNSLQCDLKNEIIKDTFLDFDTDFVGLTETRHKSDQLFKNKFDPNFSSFWSTTINVHTGVGILIKRSWSIYVQKTFLDNDRFIYVDLFLAGHIKLRVFSIYLHAKRTSATKKEHLNLHKIILEHIKDGLKSDFKIILLGDFNANLDKYWSHIN